MTKLAKLVLLLLLIVPAGGCTGTDVDNFVGFVDIFLGEDEPEKTESEKWVEEQQKKNAKWMKQQEDEFRRRQEYQDCLRQYIFDDQAVKEEKCGSLKP